MAHACPIQVLDEAHHADGHSPERQIMALWKTLEDKGQIMPQVRVVVVFVLWLLGIAV
jgi:hypothetical protein